MNVMNYSRVFVDDKLTVWDEIEFIFLTEKWMKEWEKANERELIKAIGRGKG
jgi:hypothetical protein